MIEDEIRNVLCVFSFLIIVNAIYTSYNYSSWALAYTSINETMNMPKDFHIEIEKEQQNGILKDTISQPVKNSNERIIISVDKKGLNGSEKQLNLKDPEKSCKNNFKCVITNSTGWNDKNSLMVSTVNTTKDRSSIAGRQISVMENDRYLLESHIKINNHARSSNILIQGFNESSKSWNEISRCPYNIRGPLEWKEFRCSITIEQNITKIRPVFNAGWSARENREAITWFDYFNITKFDSYLADPDLKSEVIYEGLKFPTSMAMLGPNDFLIIEKNSGDVKRITNGVSTAQPVLQVNAYPEGDSGMLGILVDKNLSSKPGKDKSDYVFLYFTTIDEIEEKKYPRNHLYRYELTNNTLNNPRLLLNLPAGYYHNGGPILMGPDNRTIYLSVGDVENQSYKIIPHKALNNKSGAEPDGTGGVLQFTKNGKPINEGILGNNYPLNLYYAYGIRESFGMDFDPITGKLWDTENGHDVGDEINMIEPGFNGGWSKLQGIWPFFAATYIPNASNVMHNPSDLVTFQGKGKYRSPEFTWNQTVAPTALTFVTTDKLGSKYRNDMFVADANYGRIYHFKLNQDRTALLLEGPLADKIADNDKELKDIIFAGDFGLISDMDVGPDGYLYFLTFNEGKIYRIMPKNQFG